MKITRALWICAFAVAVIDCLLIRAAVFESQRRNSGTVSSTAFLSSTASRYERAQAQTKRAWRQGYVSAIRFLNTAIEKLFRLADQRTVQLRAG